ncbi:MAG: hypothetical protein AABY64_04580 [Bdellovibrionota bacterium]
MQDPQIHQLIAVPEEKRDTQWENLFFHSLTQSSLDILSEAPQTGPDGLPYLLTQISEKATEPTSKIIQWLSDKGIGLVVNPTKEYPDYVFTYGMIWHFKESGYFYHVAEDRKAGTVEIQVNEKYQYGEPSLEYLPLYVRKILREFFRDQGLFAVKVLMLSQDGKNFDLAISLECLGNPPESEHQGIAEVISWFLPPHYSLLLVSEKDLPKFFEL